MAVNFNKIYKQKFNKVLYIYSCIFILAEKIMEKTPFRITTYKI